LQFTVIDNDLQLQFGQIKIKDFDKWKNMKTDEDLKEVNSDIENDVRAQRRLS
jgi:hypothetical protein